MKFDAVSTKTDQWTRSWASAILTICSPKIHLIVFSLILRRVSNWTLCSLTSHLIELVMCSFFVVRNLLTYLRLFCVELYEIRMKFKFTCNYYRTYRVLFKICNALIRISQWPSDAKRKAETRSREIRLTRWREGAQKQNIMSEGERIRNEGLPVYKRIMMKKRKYGEWNNKRIRLREGEKWE